MQEVRINGSRMFIWPGVHTEAGENIRVLSPETLRIFIVTDRPCIPIARHVAMSLQQQSRYDVTGGVAVPTKVRAKAATLSQLKSKIDALGPKGVCVVAVGGTAVVHLGMRLAGNRPLFLVPTTLRAQLDAAVGGTSCPQLADRWRPPKAVFSDPTLLRDVPLREFIAGLAEAVRGGVVQDPDLFDVLEANAVRIRNREQAVLEDLVFRAATVKAAAVGSPTPGPGARATFHYGHLIGGALEQVAGSALLHGEALSVGMEAEASLARTIGWADDDLVQRQNKLLKALGLPTRVKGLPAARLAQPLLAKGSVKIDLPDAIGHSKGQVELKPGMLQAAIAAVTK